MKLEGPSNKTKIAVVVLDKVKLCKKSILFIRAALTSMENPIIFY